MIIIFPDGCSQRSGFPLLESTRNGDTWCWWTLFRWTISATVTPTTDRLGLWQGKPTRPSPPAFTCTQTPHTQENNCRNKPCLLRNWNWQTICLTKTDMYVYQTFWIRNFNSSFWFRNKIKNVPDTKFKVFLKSFSRLFWIPCTNINRGSTSLRRKNPRETNPFQVWMRRNLKPLYSRRQFSSQSLLIKTSW